jgi:hypothetical protein
MTTTRDGSRGASRLVAAGLALVAACLLGAPEASAQWTQPDAAGNIGNTNPGNVRVGGAGAPTAVVHTRGNLSSPLTGTVAVTQNSAAVTGTGTDFTTELAVGDSIKVGAEVFTVAAIASATSLTLDSNYLGASATGATAYRDPNLFAVDNGDSASKMVVTRSGKLGIGSTAPGSSIVDIVNPAANIYSLLTNPVDTVRIRTLNNSQTGNNYSALQWRVSANNGTNNALGFMTLIQPSHLSHNSEFAFTLRRGDGSYAEAMRIQSSGNVGIGTSTPSNALVIGTDFGAQSAPTSSVVIGNVSDSSLLTLGQSSSSRVRLKWFYNANAGAAYAALGTLNGSNNLILQDGGGNVGVGTAAPAYRLDVAGSVNSTGLCLAGTCKTDWSQVGGGQWASGTGTVSYTGGGYVGVGTSSPIRGLQVSGPNGSGLSEFVLENTGMPANNRKFNLWGASTLGASGRFFFRLLNDAGSATTRDFMAFDNATGNIGVGTNAPDQRLSVAGTGAFYNSTPVTPSGVRGLFMGNFSGGSSIWSYNYAAGAGDSLAVSAQDLNLATYNGGNGVSRLFINNSGNVGIGTTAPGSQLFVGSGTPSIASLPGVNVALGPTTGSYVSASNNTVNTFIGSDASPYGIVGTLSNHPLGLRANNTLALTILPSGNVGIGTTAPAQKLDVAGSVSSTGFCLAGTCKTDWSQVGGTSQWAGNAGSSINYSGGNVGIGVAAPVAKLDVRGGPDTALLIGDRGTAGSVGLQFLGSGYKHAGLRFNGDNLVVENASNTVVPSTWYNGLPMNFIVRNGNVGVNTLNPIGPLAVGDASVSSDGFIVLGKNNGSGTRQARIGYDANFNFVVGDYGNSNVAGTWSPQFSISWQAPSNSLYVNSDGKVGVGTANPTEALDIVGNIRATGSVSATYQDVAEWVPSTQKLRAGTVVVLDAERTNHVLASSKSYDTSVAGVISDSPGVILGVGGEGKLKVATTGRVKVRVNASRGAVKVGDLLVTSEVEGVAMKSVPVDLGGTPIHRPGTIIGKALEPLEKGEGEILVLLSLQ